MELTSTKPDYTILYTAEMSDVDPRDAETAVYSSVIATFAPGTRTPAVNAGGGEGGASSGLVVGMSFLWFFIGICCAVGSAVGFMKYADGGLEGVTGFCSTVCGEACSMCGEACSSLQSHAGYGQLGDAEAGEARAPDGFAARVEVSTSHWL